MNQYTISPATWNSVQLVTAIRDQDEQRVEALLKSQVAPEILSQTVRVNSTNAVEPLSFTQGVKHAQLWALPVVIRSGGESLMPRNNEVISLKSDLLSQVVKRSFTEREEVRFMSSLWPYEAISGMSPTATYSICKALAGMPPGATINLNASECEATDIPTLGFIIGVACAINARPEVRQLEGEHQLKIRNLINGLISYQLGSSYLNVANNVSALEPMAFESAIERGVHHWVDTLAQDFRFHSVNLKPVGTHKYVFRLYVQRGCDVEIQCIQWEMKTSHVSESVIANLYDRLEKSCNLPRELLMLKTQMLQ